MMLRRWFGVERMSQDGTVAPSQKVPSNRIVESDIRGISRTKQLKLEGMKNTSQSLPDLTIGPATEVTTRSGNEERVKDLGVDEIQINWPKESLESINVSVCSDPLAGQFQSNSNFLYHSAENLLKTEVNRVPSPRRVFSRKKSVSSKFRAEEVIQSPSSSNSTSLLSVESQASDVTKSEMTLNELERGKEAQLERAGSRMHLEVPTPRNDSSPNRTPTKGSKRSSKSRKRSRTLAGSELSLSAEVLKNALLQEDDFQSDGENREGVLGRAKPGWRSASVKGSTTEKSVEVSTTVPKSDCLTARTIPFSKLDEFLVLASDVLEENTEVQALKVDVAQNSFPVSLEELASYLEDTWQCSNISFSASSVVVLLPASRNTSSTLTGFLSQLVDVKRKLCISKGNVALSRVQGAWSYSRYMFLTSEYLFVMKQKTGTTFKLKKKVALYDLWIGPDPRHSGEVGHSSGSHSFIIGWPLATNYVFIFNKTEQKTMWMNLLEKLITAERVKDENREIIRISTQDSDCTLTKSLVVNSEETALQIIQRCLKELHLIESDPKNFELCVKSRDTLIPLMGHEIPYCIQLKSSMCKKEQEGQLLKTSLHQDLGSTAFDHFVLQPKKTPQRNGFRQRARRPRRITLVGLFGRKTATPQPDVLQSMPKAKLFGQILAEVCSGDLLPKSVMDLLRILYIRGPVTPGIFRKSGNHRDLLELKAKLDAGEECNMEDVTIHVAASAVKNWLRSLPDCLLLTSLYHQWIETISLADETEKHNNMKRLVSLLPSHNLLLLRYLICILNNVSSQSERNHMTSGNLAICLGPTILWPEGTVDLTSECVSMELVARVTQLLIDDAHGILGEDCLNLFRDLSDREEPVAETEIIFDSEDSMASQDMLSVKRDLTEGASVESLDNFSIDDASDAHSCSAVQSQMSVDSGLAVSNPLLYDDPDSASVRPTPPPDQPRYAKRQLGSKKKLHAKSDLSDISEALTIPDLEERSGSKMAGASGVRQRVSRFRASMLHGDDSLNDSGGEHFESSEEEFISSTENLAKRTGSAGVFNSNNDTVSDGLSQELDESLESDEADISERQKLSDIGIYVSSTSENVLEGQIGDKGLPDNEFQQEDLSGSVERTFVTDKEENLQTLDSAEVTWYFTGPDEDLQSNLQNLISVPSKQKEKKVMKEESSRVKLAATRVHSQPKICLKLSSDSVRSDHSNKKEYNIPTKHNSLDRSARYTSHPSAVVNSSPVKELLPSKVVLGKSETSPLRLRLTGFQVIDKQSAQQTGVSQFRQPSCTDLVSVDSSSRNNHTSTAQKQSRERSVPRRFTDVAVNTNDSWFRKTCGVQTESPVSSSVSVPEESSPKAVRRKQVEDSMEEVESGILWQRRNFPASDSVKRNKSDVDLRRRSWREEYAECYSSEALKAFVPTVDNKMPKRNGSEGPVRTFGRLVQSGESARSLSEESDCYSGQQHSKHTPFSKMSCDQSRASDKTRNEASVCIEQRIKDRRAVTVVTIGRDDSPASTSQPGSYAVHQPVSIQFPVKDIASHSAGNQRSTYSRSRVISRSVDQTDSKHSDSRNSTGFAASDKPVSKYFIENHSEMDSKSNTKEFTPNLRSYHGSNFALPEVESPYTNDKMLSTNAAHLASSPWHHKVSGHPADNLGHVFGSQNLDVSGKTDSSASRFHTPRRNNTSHIDTLRRSSSQHKEQRSSSHHRNTIHADSPQSIDAIRHHVAQYHVENPQNSFLTYMDAQRHGGDFKPSVSPRQSEILKTAKVTKSKDMKAQSSSVELDEPLITWSVNELKKRFDSTAPSSCFSSPRALVKKH